MNESFEEIIAQYNNLTDKEKHQMVSALSSHFGKPIQISMSALSTYNKEEIEIITNVLNGIIITKQNAPNMRDAYERLKGTEVPRKISFGYVEDSENN